MISLEEFKQFFSDASILVPDMTIEIVYEKLVASLEGKAKIETDKNPVKQFIARFCELYKEKHNVNPVIDGRAQGVAKRIVKGMGLDKSIALVESYLSMPDAYFVARRHDLVTFEANIQSVNVYHARGQVMTRTQTHQLDKKISNANAFQHLLEKTNGKR